MRLVNICLAIFCRYCGNVCVLNSYKDQVTLSFTCFRYWIKFKLLFRQNLFLQAQKTIGSYYTFYVNKVEEFSKNLRLYLYTLGQHRENA